VPGWGVVGISVAAAVVVGVTLSVQDWQAVRDNPSFLGHLIVDAITALVLTPLAVTIFLTLRGRTEALLQRLGSDEVVVSAAGDRNKALKAFARRLDRRRNRKWPLAVAVTVVYVGLTAFDALKGRTELVTWIALVVQAALLYVGVLAVAQVLATCRAIGRLLCEFKVCVQPLHPDGCGGLWPIGSLLNSVLFAAVILGGTSLAIGALEGTSSLLRSRPEALLLASFYAILLPFAFHNLLWRPHELMRKRRAEILAPVAEAFNKATDDSEQLEAKADCDAPSEITKRFLVLDGACPTWPLGLRRLQAVTVTAVLPVAIPIVTAVISSVVTGGP
jgi:hypothetical protein